MKRRMHVGVITLLHEDATSRCAFLTVLSAIPSTSAIMVLVMLSYNCGRACAVMEMAAAKHDSGFRPCVQ